MTSSTFLVGLTVLATAAFAGLGLVAARRDGRVTLNAFLTARGSVRGWTMPATVGASFLGVWILFTPAEAGVLGGPGAILGYALGAAVLYGAYALLGPRLRTILPAGRSLTDFVWVRYGRPAHALTLGASVFYMFVHLAAELTAIALLAHLVAGVPLGVTAGVIAAGTVLYVAYGGLRASIRTDAVQGVLVLGLLAAVAGATLAAVGGPAGVQSALAAAPTATAVHWSGVEYGLALFLAVVSANLFHQGYWQRVYAGADARVLRNGFGVTALLVLPVLLVAGGFGLLAQGLGVVDAPSTALFAVVSETLGAPFLVVVFALAVVLVMSTTDTLLNGMASLFAVDAARWGLTGDDARTLRLARVLTIVLVVPAVLVASQGYSVLVLFLVADLVCAAGVVPLFYGFYRRGHSGVTVVVGWLGGLAAGAVLLIMDGPFQHLLASFATALAASAVLSAMPDVLRLVRPRRTDAPATR